MFKKKGLAGLAKPGFKSPAAPAVPSAAGMSPENPSNEEDGMSQGERLGSRGGAGAPRRPRGMGLARLGPRY